MKTRLRSLELSDGNPQLYVYVRVKKEDEDEDADEEKKKKELRHILFFTINLVNFCSAYVCDVLGRYSELDKHSL